MSQPPTRHKTRKKTKSLFSCFPLRLFPVVFVYSPPFWFLCNDGEVLNNLFSLRGIIALVNEPREGSYADGFFCKSFFFFFK